MKIERLERQSQKADERRLDGAFQWAVRADNFFYEITPWKKESSMAKPRMSKAQAESIRKFDQAAESFLPRDKNGKTVTSLMKSKRDQYNAKRRVSNGGKGG